MKRQPTQPQRTHDGSLIFGFETHIPAPSTTTLYPLEEDGVVLYSFSFVVLLFERVGVRETS